MFSEQQMLLLHSLTGKPTEMITDNETIHIIHVINIMNLVIFIIIMIVLGYFQGGD